MVCVVTNPNRCEPSNTSQPQWQPRNPRGKASNALQRSLHPTLPTTVVVSDIHHPMFFSLLQTLRTFPVFRSPIIIEQSLYCPIYSSTLCSPCS